MTESDLEHLAITWFQDAGWDHRAGPDIAPDSDTPERSDYRQVLLQGELREALARLNPSTPANVLDEVAHQLAKPEHLSLIQSNRAFHEALVSGVPVEMEIAGERRGDRVQLVDFDQPERNHFLVVTQFTVQHPGQAAFQLGLFQPGPPIHDDATAQTLGAMAAKGAMQQRQILRGNP